MGSNATPTEDTNTHDVTRPTNLETLAGPKLKTTERPDIVRFLARLRTYNAQVQEKVDLGEHAKPMGIMLLIDETIKKAICTFELEKEVSAVSNEEMLTWLEKRCQISQESADLPDLNKIFEKLGMVMNIADPDARVLRLFTDVETIVAEQGLENIISKKKNSKTVNKIIVTKLQPSSLKNVVEKTIDIYEPETWSDTRALYKLVKKHAKTAHLYETEQKPAPSARTATVTDKMCKRCPGVRKPHTADECWKEHPELAPEWYTNKGNSDKESTDTNDNKHKKKISAMAAKIAALTATVEMMTKTNKPNAVQNYSMQPRQWAADSACTHMMTNQSSNMTNYSADNTEISTAKAESGIRSVGQGELLVQYNNLGAPRQETLPIMHVPELGEPSLYSVRQAVQPNRSMIFDSQQCRLVEGTIDIPSNNIVAIGHQNGGLWIMDIEESSPPQRPAEDKVASLQAGVPVPKNDINFVHAQFGHRQIPDIRLMAKGPNGIKLNPSIKPLFCDSCAIGKARRKPFPKKRKNRQTPLLLGTKIWMDGSGPQKGISLTGEEHFLTHTEDTSRHKTTSLMHTKDESAMLTMNYVAWLERKTGNPVKIIHCDNAQELIAGELAEWCAQKGIEIQTNAPYSSEQNMAEVGHRILMNSARSMIHFARLPKHFMGHAILYANEIYNLCPHPADKTTTPTGVLNGTEPNRDHIGIFGCDAYAVDEDTAVTKADPRAKTYTLIGLAQTSKSYKLFDPITHQIVDRRNVDLNQQGFGNRQAEDAFSTDDALLDNVGRDPDYVPSDDEEDNEEDDDRDDRDSDDNEDSPDDEDRDSDDNDDNGADEEYGEPDALQDRGGGPQNGAAPEQRRSTRERRPVIRFGNQVNHNWAATACTSSNRFQPLNDFPDLAHATDYGHRKERDPVHYEPLRSRKPKSVPRPVKPRSPHEAPTWGTSPGLMPNCPDSLEEAMNGPDKEQWMSSMGAYLDRLEGPDEWAKSKYGKNKNKPKTSDSTETPRPKHWPEERKHLPCRPIANAARVAQKRTESFATMKDCIQVLRTHYAHLVEVRVPDTPDNYEKATTGPDKAEWGQSIKSELNSLEDNGTYEDQDPTTLPKGAKVIGCKWVFKVKKIGADETLPEGNTWIIRTLPDGSRVRFKARLVIKGFLQKFGRDYTETFAEVVRPDMIRLVMAMSVEDGDIHVEQLDIVTAFLHGLLTEDVYMDTPQGSERRSKVVKLLKALYGLKQAPREWFKVINAFLVNELGFTKLKSTTCMYVKRAKDGKYIIIALYVDDLTLAGHQSMIDEVKAALKGRFAVSDLGPIQKVIGIRVRHSPDRKSVFLDQEDYAREMLKLYGMESCASVVTPTTPDIKLTKAMSPQSDQDILAAAEETIPYRNAVSSLQFLVHTRPELAPGIGQVARFVQNPGIQHFKALKRIFRFIQGTLNHGLLYERSKSAEDNKLFTLSAMSDSDWAGNLDDRRSTSGYLVRLNDNVITFKAAPQSCVSLSTCEAETVALTRTAQEVIWLRGVLRELGFPQEQPTTIYCDNDGAIAFGKDAANHSSMKHINLRECFLKEAVAAGYIRIVSISSTDNTADILTKSLGPTLFKKHRDGLHVVARPIWAS